MHQGMSKRTTITLPDSIYDDLEKWAESEGRPTANLAAFLVEIAVKQKFSEKYLPTEKMGREPK
jgi:predicted DNA-binding protein